MMFKEKKMRQLITVDRKTREGEVRERVCEPSEASKKSEASEEEDCF